jgi:septum formation protein
VPSSIFERDLLAGEDPRSFAVELAVQKAREVARHHPDATVIGADTVVFLDGMSLGKPRGADDAAEMLRKLRGQTHSVTTGVAVICRGLERRGAATADVTMRAYGDQEIDRYVAGGEPMDKAGAYAVQGAGGALVAQVDGCFDTVVGLPLCCTAELLRACGLHAPPPAGGWCSHCAR